MTAPVTSMMSIRIPSLPTIQRSVFETVTRGVAQSAVTRAGVDEPVSRKRCARLRLEAESVHVAQGACASEHLIPRATEILKGASMRRGLISELSEIAPEAGIEAGGFSERDVDRHGRSVFGEDNRAS